MKSLLLLSSIFITQCQGGCVKITDCPPLNWLAQNKYSISGKTVHEVMDYLNNKNCGFDGLTAKVLCPADDQVEVDVDRKVLSEANLDTSHGTRYV